MKMKIAVVVLGPLDRSPRMLNHAVSFAEANPSAQVDFIGYDGTLNQKFNSLQNARKVPLSTYYDCLKDLPRLFYLFYAIVRVFYQIV